jgi:hypothetical protein
LTSLAIWYITKPLPRKRFLRMLLYNSIQPKWCLRISMSISLFIIQR